MDLSLLCDDILPNIFWIEEALGMSWPFAWDIFQKQEKVQFPLFKDLKLSCPYWANTHTKVMNPDQMICAKNNKEKFKQVKQHLIKLHVVQKCVFIQDIKQGFSTKADPVLNQTVNGASS